MVNISLLISSVAFLIVALAVAVLTFLKLKKAPKEEQLLVKHYALETGSIGMDLINKYAGPAIINAAMNPHLVNGLVKKDKAVRDVMDVLRKHGIDKPSFVIVSKMIEATYQSLKPVLKKAGLDSRTNPTVPSADKLDADALQKKITDPTINK